MIRAKRNTSVLFPVTLTANGGHLKFLSKHEAQTLFDDLAVALGVTQETQDPPLVDQDEEESDREADEASYYEEAGS